MKIFFGVLLELRENTYHKVPIDFSLLDCDCPRESWNARRPETQMLSTAASASLFISC